MARYEDLDGILEGRIGRPDTYGIGFWNLVIGGLVLRLTGQKSEEDQ